MRSIRDEYIRLQKNAGTEEGTMAKKIKKEAEQALARVSWSLWVSFLEARAFKMAQHGPDMYDLFTFDALQKLHLGTSKIRKEFVVAFLLSERLMTTGCDAEGGARKPFFRMKKAFLRGFSVFLFAFEKDSGVAALNVDF